LTPFFDLMMWHARARVGPTDSKSVPIRRRAAKTMVKTWSRVIFLRRGRRPAPAVPAFGGWNPGSRRCL